MNPFVKRHQDKIAGVLSWLGRAKRAESPAKHYFKNQ